MRPAFAARDWRGIPILARSGTSESWSPFHAELLALLRASVVVGFDRLSLLIDAMKSRLDCMMWLVSNYLAIFNLIAKIGVLDFFWIPRTSNMVRQKKRSLTFIPLNNKIKKVSAHSNALKKHHDYRHHLAVIPS